MERITSLIRADGEYGAFAELLPSAYRAAEPLPIAVNGLTGGAESAFLAESVRDARAVSSAPVLVLAANEGERERAALALAESGLRTLVYKKRDLVFYNIKASHDVDRERLSVLSAVTAGECDAVVTTPSAALSYTVPEEMLLSLSVAIKVGDILSPEALSERLVTLGFIRVDTVESAGQFARRGGIVDYFGAESESPVRIEFFGDEVDRISLFDPLTQRSLDSAEEARLIPATEVMISSAARGRILDFINAKIPTLPEGNSLDKLKREKTIIEGDGSVDFRDKYLGLIYENPASLLSYFSTYKRCVIFALGTSGCTEELKKYTDFIENEKISLLSEGLVNEIGARYLADETEYNRFLAENLTIHINAFSGGVGTMKLAGLFGFRARRCVSYGRNPAMLHDDLSALRKGLYRVVIVTDNKQGARELVSSLAEADFAAVPIYDKPDFDVKNADGGRIFVTVARTEGFELITPKIAVLSMAIDEGRAVMQHRKHQRTMRRLGGASQRLMSHADISPGDYVVHANYGIGLFEGIEAVTVGGVTRDYITIKYAGTDKLFLPCDRLEMIGKYIGEREGDGTVKLSKMGGTEWARTKSRAKAAAKDIAKGLIALYAERQRKPGFAFPADSDLEDSFADSFEYELTESQMVAIEEIKRDMMRPVPMNRLLCGDVGFGKTEVALRAAFKAIMGGKQVAILVPTTILAAQHYATAISRTRGYPVTVEMLSRFKKPREQAEILRKLARGETDIVIGTHKLLSKNIEFRDLGLLIVDEEQRFGVAQKEKLKELARNVDVLTLSATPIPRTLNMAMNGINDISILDEAPGERRPVQTYVLEHDDSVILDAIRRELAREGQVLYLYNNIEKIDFVATKIIDALPEARVAVAHGKMEREELEDVWGMLVAGEIDVLVCTTIVETGIDLPTANTLIIENADRFGLSQLHQIRGRVGRGARQAYAYFTYRPGKALTDIAEKRLSAIKEYAEFGAGFKIALCDLEIRGAGNLLGAQQHGYIDSVGYDLYVKLLNEAVLEERGERKPEAREAHVDLQVNAHIPESYIPSGSARMEMYKKISLIRTPDDESDIYDELTDRFGNMPKSVKRLLDVALMRAIAEQGGISRIEEKSGSLIFVIDTPNLAVWSEVFYRHRNLRLAPSGDRVVCRLAGDEPTALGVQIMKDYYKAMCDIKSTAEE